MKKTYVAIIALIAIIVVVAIGFTVFHETTALEIHGDIKDDGHYYFKVINSDNKPMQDFEFNVTEYLDKKLITKYTIKTDSNGMIKGELKNKQNGTHSVVASHKDDSNKVIGTTIEL